MEQKFVSKKVGKCELGYIKFKYEGDAQWQLILNDHWVRVQKWAVSPSFPLEEFFGRCFAGGDMLVERLGPGFTGELIRVDDGMSGNTITHSTETCGLIREDIYPEKLEGWLDAFKQLD